MASLIQRPNGIYYIQHRVSGKARRISTGTENYQLASEKLRQFESATYRGGENPLPMCTPIAQVVGEYMRHIRTFKTGKSVRRISIICVIRSASFARS